MRSYLLFATQCGFFGLLFSLIGSGVRAASLPENLALKATATANSEHSGSYLARFAIDGKIPAAGGQDDLHQAWCVNGATHRDHATLTLQWPGDITVAEIVYWGRTAWFAEECWKDYEIYLDQASKPAAKGQFQMGHGPQRIRLAKPRQARTITFQFLSSYGGMNPGASEIQVYAVPVPDKALPAFQKLPPGRPDLSIVTVEDSPELARMVKDGRLGFQQLLLIQRHPIDSSHVYTYHVEGFRPGGGLWVYGSGQFRKLVDSPQGQILDCDLSYDGREILFSWRKGPNEGYHLYTINLDGTNLRQLSDGHWHDYNGCYLPDGGIVFLSTRSARFAYCWISPVGLLYRMDAGGANVRRLSANIVNDFTPSVMEDGRIIYSRWEYVDRPAIPIQKLWTINPDGTNLVGFYGNRVLSPATFMNARTIPGTGKVLCLFTSHNGPARGAVGIVDRRIGDNAQEAIVNLTPEINIGRVDQGDGNNVHGPYETPYPLDAQRYLASRAGAVVVREYASTRQAVIVPPRDGMGFCNALPIRPRRRPPVIPSTLPARTGSEGTATVFLQDVYHGLEPQVQRGEVKEICVVQEMEKTVKVDLNNRAFDFQFPVISCGATYAGKKVWGYAQVAPDGSACFKVPAGLPLYFIALDAQGRGVQRMRTFTHFMPGETQGCIGCHEPRNHASRLRPGTALALQPQNLRPPEWGTGVGFDYCSVVQPVLDRHCTRCHSGPTPPRKVDLSGDKTDFFNVSYEWLARGRKGNDWIQWDSPYVSWIPTYNGHEANILQITPRAWGSPVSKLAELVLSGHRDQDGTPRVQLSDLERRRIFAWIDLNIPYYGTSEAAYPELQGCRRVYPAHLNKVLADVAGRRCAECHKNGQFPRKVWVRITNPQLNEFLTAPLARTAGGSGACGKVVFSSRSDPDYQAILKTFEPVAAMLKARPRDDMPGAKPAENLCRDCQ